jgi:hypothetical protein
MVLFLMEWIRAAVRALSGMDVCARWPILKDEGRPEPEPVSRREESASGGRLSKDQRWLIESKAVKLVRSMIPWISADLKGLVEAPSPVAMIIQKEK